MTDRTNPPEDRDGLRGAGCVITTAALIMLAVSGLCAGSVVFGPLFGESERSHGQLLNNRIIYVVAALSLAFGWLIWAIGRAMTRAAHLRAERAAGRSLPRPPSYVSSEEFKRGGASFAIAVAMSSLFLAGAAGTAATSVALASPSALLRDVETWGVIALVSAALAALGTALWILGRTLGAPEQRGTTARSLIGPIAFYLGPIWIFFAGLYAAVAAMVGGDIERPIGEPWRFGLIAAMIGVAIHLLGRRIRSHVPLAKKRNGE